MVPFVTAINEMARKINALKEDCDKEFKARELIYQRIEAKKA